MCSSGVVKQNNLYFTMYYVCVYVYIYLSILCLSIHLYLSMYTHTHTHIYIYTYLSVICVCVCCLYVCMMHLFYMCTPLFGFYVYCMFPCIQLSMHACMRACTICYHILFQNPVTATNFIPNHTHSTHQPSTLCNLCNWVAA